MGDHRGLLSRAEGCWTFDARDRMPRSSRLPVHAIIVVAGNATDHDAVTLPRERVRSSARMRHQLVGQGMAQAAPKRSSITEPRICRLVWNPVFRMTSS